MTLNINTKKKKRKEEKKSATQNNNTYAYTNTFARAIYNQTSALMCSGGRTFSSFYAYRTRRSTIFVQKWHKHGIICLSVMKEESTCRLFSDFNYTP